MSDYTDMLERYAAWQETFTCTDCGERKLDSEISWWPVESGGMQHYEPLCDGCWKSREKRDYEHTLLKIEAWTHQGLRFLLLGAIGGVATYIIYRVALAILISQGWVQ